MTSQAAYADEAFRNGRRRRAARSAIDTACDSLLALGGLFVANALLKLRLGLPEGAAGISLGACVVLAAIGILRAHRAPRRTSPRRGPSRARRATVATPALELAEAA